MHKASLLKTFVTKPSLRTNLFVLLFLATTPIISFFNMIIPIKVFGFNVATLVWYVFIIAVSLILAIRGIVRKINKVDFLIIAIFYLMLVLSSVIPENSRFAFESIKTFTISALPYYFLVRLLTFDDDFVKLFERITPFVIAIGFAYILIFSIKSDSTVEEMTFGYIMAIFTCFSCYSIFHNKKALLVIFWIFLSSLSFLALLLASTRGPVFVALAFLMYEFFRNKSRRVQISLIVALILLYLTYQIVSNQLWFLAIMKSFSDQLVSIGISSRFISYLTNPSLASDSSGRTIINDTILSAIFRRPLTGFGLFGDYWQINVFKFSDSTYGYAHNLILELWCDFGIILGSAILVLFLAYLFKIWTAIDKKRTPLFVFFTLFGFVTLFFTGTFVTSWTFWMLAGFLVSVSIQNRFTSYESFSGASRNGLTFSESPVFGLAGANGSISGTKNYSPSGKTTKIVHVMLSNPFAEGMDYQEAILCKKEVSLGFSVSLVVSCEEYTKEKSIRNVEPGTTHSPDRYDIIRLPIKKTKSKLLKIGNPHTDLYLTLAKEKPDIIFFHNFASANARDVVNYMAENPDSQLYLDSHSDLGNMAYKDNPIKRFIVYRVILSHYAHLLAKIATRIWGVTPDRCDFLKGIYQIEEPVDLLVMGADEACIHPEKRSSIRKGLSEKYGIPESAFLLCFGGVIDEAKNFDVLIKAFTNSNLLRSKTYLLVFGSFSEKSKIRLPENLPVNVVYVGWKSNVEICDLFVASDLGIFPGSHSVLWEQAVACGLPCLFNDLDGKHHVDIGGNCIIGDYKNATVLQKQMETVANDYGIYETMKRIANSNKREEFWYINIAKKSIEPKNSCENKQETQKEDKTKRMGMEIEI